MARSPHRIAAGGIIFRDNSILLVRYKNPDGGSYLVAPGGAVEDHENAYQAAVRETWEETGVDVVPQKILWIEDLLCKYYKMTKIWILCDFRGGQIQNTQGAKDEGIIAVDWFTKSQLAQETIYPPPLMQYDWQDFESERWQVQCLPTKRANF